MSPLASAFARLRALNDGVPAPAGLVPVQLHLGESRLGTGGVDGTLLADPDGWTRYPPLGGTPALRTAYTGWLRRRFGAGPLLDGRALAVEPTPGTKQALATALALAVERVRSAGGGAAERVGGAEGRPVVVLPNPFYPTYHAATAAVGARPVFYDPRGGPAALEDAVATAGGAIAAVIVCDPGNPRGELLATEFLDAATRASVTADALLLVDECYTDLWLARPPAGYLALVRRGAVRPERFLVLHTLSKRSGAPGLRSGFAAGDPGTVADYARHNQACGVPTPLPVCAAAARLWDDDAHVERARAELAANWALADRVLAGVAGYRRADAGFFLWLPVGDDEAAARALWRDQALTVMPGRYLAAGGPDGTNPGAGHLRVALVHDEPLMREALHRLRAGLTRTSPLLCEDISA
ncbi:aminotransferase class I/II-fold pyridoxal phosphate-dependent enzyme [Streptomyces sp. NPDC060198]|uniref:aminotransferase class I/II-fold pyridoxal phosphate-dependent enzyme n=1 Tax=Streptomyces sp. NPDC060198 TaxID=3347070 RepID=UPI003663C71D